MIQGKSIYLADDDADDCILFEDALRQVATNTLLRTANNGVELMDILDKTVPPPPDVIFLDLNMPLKNGFECLNDIKSTQRFKDIPVVVFSTSSEQDAIEKVYADGAHYYICKPGSFAKLKSAIGAVLAIDWTKHQNQPPKESFLLNF